MEQYPNFRSLRLKKATKSARMKSKKAFKDKKRFLAIHAGYRESMAFWLFI